MEAILASTMADQDRDLFFLAESLNSIREGPDLNSKLAELVRLAAQAAKADAASLYLVNEDEGVLQPAVVLGLPDDYVRGCGNVAIGDQCCGRAVKFRRPWIVSDMQTDPLFATAKAASDSSGIRAAFSVPVIDASERCLASLACHYRKPYQPTAYEIERNRVFAILIAFTIVQSRLVQGKAGQPFALSAATNGAD